MPPRDTQIPLEALRDLLGVVRALYAAWSASGEGPIELEALRSIGKDLASALELAGKTRPDTVGHRAAWGRAEDATKRLCELVADVERLQPTIEAGAARVVGQRGPAPKLKSVAEREAKKHHSRMRG
jgi:hypothetical protein